jgi:hypothetical protein
VSLREPAASAPYFIFDLIMAQDPNMRRQWNKVGISRCPFVSSGAIAQSRKLRGPLRSEDSAAFSIRSHVQID